MQSVVLFAFLYGAVICSGLAQSVEPTLQFRLRTADPSSEGPVKVLRFVRSPQGLHALCRVGSSSVLISRDHSGSVRQVPIGEDYPLSFDVDDAGRYISAHIDRSGKAEVQIRSGGQLVHRWPAPARFRLDTVLAAGPIVLLISRDGRWLRGSPEGLGDAREVQTVVADAAAGLVTDSAGAYAIVADPVGGTVVWWKDGNVGPARLLSSPAIERARQAFGRENEQFRAKGVRTRAQVLAWTAVSPDGTLAVVATGWKLEEGMPLDRFAPDGHFLGEVRLRPPLSPNGRLNAVAGMQFNGDKVWVSDEAGLVSEFDLRALFLGGRP